MSRHLRKEPTEENILTLDEHLNPSPPPSNGTIATQGITNHHLQQQQQQRQQQTNL